MSQVGEFLKQHDALHQDFRLWITTEAHPNFPTAVLHMGTKFTTEAPVGVRASLRSSFQWLTQVGIQQLTCDEYVSTEVKSITMVLASVSRTYWMLLAVHNGSSCSSSCATCTLL